MDHGYDGSVAVGPSGSSADQPYADGAGSAPTQPWPGRDEPHGQRRGPTHYELRVDGHLGRQWSTWFDGLALTHEDDGTTTLRGAVTDQAELHGVLAKVRDIGATLTSLTPIDADSPKPSQQE